MYFTSGDLFVGMPVAQEKAIYQKGIDEQPEFSRAPLAKAASIKGGCSFPIKLKQTTYGVLEFFNDVIDGMDKNIVDFFTDLGTTIGTYIEKLETKKNLKASEELFHNAFNYSAVGIALTSIEGDFQEANRTLSDMLGYSKSEFLQKSYKDIIHPDDFSRNSNAMNQLVGGVVPSFHTEVRLLSKSNNYIWSFLAASLARDGNKLPLNIIFQIQDISYVKST